MSFVGCNVLMRNVSHSALTKDRPNCLLNACVYVLNWELSMYPRNRCCKSSSNHPSLWMSQLDTKKSTLNRPVVVTAIYNYVHHCLLLLLSPAIITYLRLFFVLAIDRTGLLYRVPGYYIRTGSLPEKCILCPSNPALATPSVATYPGNSGQGMQDRNTGAQSWTVL